MCCISLCYVYFSKVPHPFIHASKVGLPGTSATEQRWSTDRHLQSTRQNLRSPKFRAIENTLHKLPLLTRGASVRTRKVVVAIDNVQTRGLAVHPSMPYINESQSKCLSYVTVANQSTTSTGPNPHYQAILHDHSELVSS